ncbi:MAG: hypothetical protein K2Q22_07455, partial [Cytophagales bacterium]|nr:hypothetical protein [Cytophagales bacterium]
AQVVVSEGFRATVKIPTLSELANPKPKQVTEVVSKSEEEIPLTNTKPLSKTDFQSAWMELAESRKNIPNEHMILNGRELIFGENNLITIKLENKILLDKFNQVRSDWGEFLRNKLGNVSFKMEALVMEKEEKKSMYTSSDKYQYLVSKNPLLEELKVKLGLDLDY